MHSPSDKTQARLPRALPDTQRFDANGRRRTSAPWMAALALPVAVPLGVMLPVAALPGAAYAQTTFSGTYTRNINLSSYGSGNPFTIANGTSIAVSTGIGIYGGAGPSWTVMNQGSISGTTAVYLGSGNFTNSGSVAGINGTGVHLGSGSVTNTAGATISGQQNGVSIDQINATITNHGTIQVTGSPTGAAVLLQNGGTVSNLGTASKIFGVGDAILIGGGGGVATIWNEGTVSSASAIGVHINARGGTVTNSGTLSNISGGSVGIFSGGTATVINNGTVSGNLGIDLQDGSISNLGAQSLIQGSAFGILVRGGVTTVTNEGQISASTSIGVALQSGGTVVNSGTISGVTSGITVSAGDALITNTGTISGDGANGIGVLFQSGAQGTIDNSGLIRGGSGTAVKFSGGTNKLIIESGGVLSGVADGVNGSNTLELRGSGKLDDAQVLGFQTVLFNGTTTIDSQSTVDNATIGSTGTVTNTGTITGGATVQGGGVLINPGSITGGTDGIVTTGGLITNSGTIVGTSGTGVILTGTSSSLTNTSGGYIRGGTYGVMVSGGGVINAGTILDDGIAGASIGNNATINNGATGTIGGVTGALFTGTGSTLTNTGTITGTGGVAVQFGAGANTLNLGAGSVLNGRIDGGGGSGQIVLNDTGTLTTPISAFGAGSALGIASGASWAASGNWAIASVNNAGTFQAGTLASPLHLTGNFSQAAGATLVAVVNADGTHSQFLIDGTASLGGTLGVTSSGTFMSAGKSYTFLNATGGVSGTFGNVAISNALLSPSVAYGANDVTLTLRQLPVVSATPPAGGSAGDSAAGTPNQRATALALDRGIAADPAAFAATLTGLDQLTGPQVRNSLDHLSGEIHANLPTVALMAGEQFINQFHQQSVVARLGDNATAADGNLGNRQQYASLNGTPSNDPWSSKPWGFWTSGYGQSGHIDGDGNSHRLNESIAGGAVGVDYKVSPALRVGVTAGYGSSSDRLDNGGGHAHVDYTQLGAYGSYTHGPAYLDGIIGVAFGDGRTSRDVSLPGAPGTARADMSSTQVLGSLETGYKLPLGNTLTLTPLAGLSFGTVWQHGYTEHGGDALDLDVQSQTKSTVKSSLGARLSADVPVSRWTVATSLQVSWSHEFAPTDRSSTAYFAGVPSTGFSVTGARVATNSANVVAGLATKLSASSSLYLNYDGNFSSVGNSNAVMGGFKYVW